MRNFDVSQRRRQPKGASIGGKKRGGEFAVEERCELTLDDLNDVPGDSRTAWRDAIRDDVLALRHALRARRGVGSASDWVDLEAQVTEVGARVVEFVDAETFDLRAEWLREIADKKALLKLNNAEVIKFNNDFGELMRSNGIVLLNSEMTLRGMRKILEDNGLWRDAFAGASLWGSDLDAPIGRLGVGMALNQMLTLYQKSISMENKRLRDFSGANEKYYAARLRVLREFRDFGGTFKLEGSPSRNVVAAMSETASYMPSDWVDASNGAHDVPWDVRPLMVRESVARAHYSTRGKKRTMEYETYRADDSLVGHDPARYEPVSDERDANGRKTFRVYEVSHIPKGRGWEKIYDPRWKQDAWRKPIKSAKYDYTSAELLIPKGKNRMTEISVHESMHRVEDTVSAVCKLEKAFYSRRTVDENGQQNPLRVFSFSGRTKEYYRDGGFISDYMGKDYLAMRGYTERATNFEILSMGAPMALMGDRGGFRDTDSLDGTPQDPDMHAFVMGTIMCA